MILTYLKNFFKKLLSIWLHPYSIIAQAIFFIGWLGPWMMDVNNTAINVIAILIAIYFLIIGRWARIVWKKRKIKKVPT